MKKFFHALRDRFRQPKWRHGKLGALLMVMFLTACVLVNVAVKALEDEYGWRRDLSFNGYATTGEETKAVLDRLANDVELYLLYQNGQMDTQLLQLLDRYAVLSDRVSVLPTDIAQNPGVLTRFPGDTQSTPQADSVIVHCPATGRYKLLSYANDFLTQGFDVEAGEFRLEGIAYEKTLTEAIIYVAEDTLPTVGILDGHGEMSMESLATLTGFLVANNYRCVPVNLRTGDALDEVDLLLMASPQKDLTDAETEQIAAFAKAGGSLFIMRDFTDPIEGMPNYLSLLRSYGVVPLPGIVVADAQDKGSYHQERLQLIPYMEPLDMTLPLIAKGMDLLLMPVACAFETPKEPSADLTVGTVLKSGPHAYIRSLTDGNDSIEKQPDDPVGEWPLALFAHRMHANGNVSRLFAIGSSAVFAADYVYQRSYAEEFLLMVMGQLLPDKTVSLDIMASTALRPALTVGSGPLAVALTVAVPLLILIIGLCVLLPRRNR